MKFTPTAAVTEVLTLHESTVIILDRGILLLLGDGYPSVTESVHFYVVFLRGISSIKIKNDKQGLSAVIPLFGRVF